MKSFKFVALKSELRQSFQKIEIHHYSEEFIIRISAAVALLTASVTLNPEILGLNTFLGSVGLCLGSILNPGYLHRISSIHGKYRISVAMAKSELKISLTSLLLLSPLLMFFQSGLSHFMIMINTIAYILMYATISLRDIQNAIIKRREIPFKVSAMAFTVGGILGALSCFAIFLFRQPAFIPLCSILVILPFLIEMTIAIRNASRHELSGAYHPIKRYSKISANFALMGMLSGLLMVVDNFIIFGMLELSELGYYGIAFAIVTFIVNIIGTTLQRKEFIRNVGQIPRTNSILLLGALIFGIILSASIFLCATYFDLQVMVHASLLSLILCLGIPFRIRNLHLTVLLEKFGSFSIRLVSLFASIALISILGIYAISNFGVVGMCIASNLSFGFLCIINRFLARLVKVDEQYVG